MLLKFLISLLKSDILVKVSKTLYETLNIDKGEYSFECFDECEEIKQANYILSFGGDGTFLNTANYIKNYNIPIIGINMGRLGFLTCVSIEDLDKLFEALKNDTIKSETRSLIEIDVENNPFGKNNTGLNEIAIHKKNIVSLLTIKAYINGEYLNTYWADGLLIATPTGSTAYSLSLGGPIISPESNTFVITPIAPHTLTIRPIIVPDNVIIELIVSSREGEFYTSIDSQYKTFKHQTTLKIYKSNKSIILGILENQNFYEKIRKKLMWGNDIRN
ncbi:MAG: NAD kinase [Bacteroidales bacterium]|nr:NAD kinase [Bacteroidales bacterium]